MSAERKTHHIVIASMLTAMAVILQLPFPPFEISVPFMPFFVKLDFSDLPALLGTFALGPMYGIAIEFVKNLIHAILFSASSSYWIGELCNFVLGSVFIAIAGWYYRHHKNRKTALWGSILGAISMGIISLPMNYFLVYPIYNIFMPMDAIIGAYRGILDSVAQFPTDNALFNCLLLFNAPFTLFKGTLNVVLCFLIYKPLSPLLHK